MSNLKFSDLLSKPLPSKMGEFTESVNEDDMDTEECGEGCKKEGECSEHSDHDDDFDDDDDDEVTTSDIDDIANSDDDFDPDSLSDEDLAALDAELSGDAVDAVAGDSDEEKLTPEEELQADDMMSVAATTMLVNDELNAEEKAQFIESGIDTQIAIDEGFMTEADVNTMAAELGLVTENSYNKKMLIRLDAASKKKQLFALGVNVSAAAHHDPDYIKLKKVMKMRKVLRARLTQKYKAEATKRMKVYFNRLRKSKSAPLAKIGNKMDK